MKDNNLSPQEWIEGAEGEWDESPLTHADPEFGTLLAEARRRREAEHAMVTSTG